MKAEWTTLAHQDKHDFSQLNVYHTEAQAQRGADSLKRRCDFYETQVVKEPWGIFRVQYRKLPGF
jgi:hypothetical protein